MIREILLKKCPFCGGRLRHRLGTEKYYCQNCRMYFFKTATAIHVKSAANAVNSVSVDVLSERLKGNHLVNAKVVRAVFKEAVDKNRGGIKKPKM